MWSIYNPSRYWGQKQTYCESVCAYKTIEKLENKTEFLVTSLWLSSSGQETGINTAQFAN